MLNVATGFYAPRTLVTTSLITAGYLLLSAVLVGFKTDQVVLAALFNLLYYSGTTSRKLITGFSIFIVYWIIFDYMKAFPNYQLRPVAIESLYNFEKKLFGINYQGTVITWNEYFNLNHTVFADIVAGVFYLCWVPVPLLFAGYLFWKNKRLFLEFSLCFLLVNLIGFIIYYLQPAAPPWYMQQYGASFLPHTPGNTAGLQRFDEYFQVSIFSSLYAKSSNVFAAMPSLHSAYPVVVLYYGVKAGLKYVNVLFAVIMVGIWMAAIYTSHHYVTDVIAGLLCAITGILIMQQLKKRKYFNIFLNRYFDTIK